MSDTMFKQNADLAEVRGVVGHEMGHYAHAHILWTVGVLVLLSALAFWLTDRLYPLAHRLLKAERVGDIADPAGLPILALVLAFLGVLGTPVSISGIALRTNNTLSPVPNPAVSSTSVISVYVDVSSAPAINVGVGSAAGITSGVVTIEYTKTTDDARTLWVYSDAGGDVVLAEQIAGSFTFTDDGAGNIVITALPAGLALTDDGNGNLEIE
jgi:hypothetical protein